MDFISGLAFNARHFDRHFLAELNEESYIETAKYLQSVITDEVIAEALGRWPEAIYAKDGKEIEAKLKSRRKDLVKYAKDFYAYLTKEVTVIGTNGKNIFDITTEPDDKLNVKTYHLDKSGDKHLIWSRVIDGKDCDELRLYGLKKKDVYNFSGTEKSSIKINLVGGSGNDILNNNSTHLKITAYDRPDGMALNGNSVRSLSLIHI